MAVLSKFTYMRNCVRPHNHSLPRIIAKVVVPREDSTHGLDVRLGNILAVISMLTTGLHSGGAIVVGGSTSLTLAHTWGGIQFAWSAAQTLVPLIIGVAALIVFFFVERFVSEPIVRTAVRDHPNVSTHIFHRSLGLSLATVHL